MAAFQIVDGHSHGFVQLEMVIRANNYTHLWLALQGLLGKKVLETGKNGRTL